MLEISAIFARSIGSARQSRTQSTLLPYRTSLQTNLTKISAHSFAEPRGTATVTNLYHNLRPAKRGIRPLVAAAVVQTATFVTAITTATTE